MTTLSDDARAYLAEPRYAVLGTINTDGTPQLSVVWYDLCGDAIVMNTARGRVKDRNVRRDPRVTLCVEDGLRYVALQGTVEIVDDPEVAQWDIYRLAVRYSGEESARRQVEDQYAHEERVTLRLRITKVTERLHGV